jgi:hypothetical protein
MRIDLIRFAAVFMMVTVLVAYSLADGQETQGQNSPGTDIQSPSSAEQPGRLQAMLAKLPPLQKQMLLGAERGADWLKRANRVDGRFVYGFLPDLRTNLEGDHYLGQVEAAHALARASRYLGQERYTAIVRQALLTLLLDTTVEEAQAQVRHTTLPSLAVNRIGAAGLLILAIHELPSAAEDLLEQAEQLCGYLRQQQLPDGSFDLTGGSKQVQLEPDAILNYPGQAILGLLQSHHQRPAPWKFESAGKALSYYLEWWRGHKNLAMVPWLSAGFAEAFELSKDRAMAEPVIEMNDWLCSLQYAELEPSHPLWAGGFMDWAEGRSVTAPPTIRSALYATALAQACRVTRRTGDLTRYRRFREALERCLQFVSLLQYTDANTQHFADWYRNALVGGFHASQEDGTLRIDYTAQAVFAMVEYLEVVTNDEKGPKSVVGSP